MTKYDLIIIGAGAAGLMCAANIKEGIKTLVLEKTGKIGTKLKISGSGQCNITHSGDISSFEKAYGLNGRFLRKALYKFSNSDLVEYFDDLGVPIIEREDGKMFPKSLKSGDIASVLTSQIRKNDHEILKNSGVTSICFNSEKNIFSINSEGNELTSSNLVIATGGASYPETGSTGDGYKFAKILGHSVSNIGPSLVPFHIKNWVFSSVAGNSFKNAAISKRSGSKKITKNGELLITHSGISGPLVLDFSRYCDTNDSVLINFLSNFNTETIIEKLNDLFYESASRKIAKILPSVGIPINFSLTVLKNSGINTEKLCGSISKKEIRKMAEMICNLEINVKKESLNKAMCTTGGVKLGEINSSTMESKLCKGLYFCGEVLDIDGDTGGYNIQAAFSTAFCAATTICNKY